MNRKWVMHTKDVKRSSMQFAFANLALSFSFAISYVYQLEHREASYLTIIPLIGFIIIALVNRRFHSESSVTIASLCFIGPLLSLFMMVQGFQQDEYRLSSILLPITVLLVFIQICTHDRFNKRYILERTAASGTLSASVAASLFIYYGFQYDRNYLIVDVAYVTGMATFIACLGTSIWTYLHFRKIRLERDTAFLHALINDSHRVCSDLFNMVFGLISFVSLLWIAARFRIPELSPLIDAYMIILFIFACPTAAPFFSATFARMVFCNGDYQKN